MELYRINGHEFAVAEEYENQGAKKVECRECLCQEVLHDGDDHEDHLELMTPECNIEWLREPDGGFHGTALRNACGFSGRELIGVREGGKLGNGEVVDSVRVYDDDAGLLASMLDQQNWEENRAIR